MEFYRTFKRLLAIKSPRIKLLLIGCGRAVGMRYAGVFLDPVMACNIRCRMCYFSDPAGRPKPCGTISDEAIDSLECNVFPYAAKLQIGCGAEPTLYSGLTKLISAGRRAGIPYIEITTNGQLLTSESLREMVQTGLNGITLSLHGTTRQTYEYLMQGAKFDKFLNLLDILRDVKREFPGFKLRVNYTVNNLNKAELPRIWELFGDLHIDILQVRPIQRLGETAYDDFVIEDIDRLHSEIIDPLRQECLRRDTTPLLPQQSNTRSVADHSLSDAAALIEDTTYIYVDPQKIYRDDFDAVAESLRRYHSRKHLTRRVLRAVFGFSSRKEKHTDNVTKKLNYQ